MFCSCLIKDCLIYLVLILFVFLQTPSTPTRSSRIITTNRPISTASSTTSLNSKSTYGDIGAESGATSGAASMASSVASLDRLGETGSSYRNGSTTGYRYKTDNNIPTNNNCNAADDILSNYFYISSDSSGLSSEKDLKTLSKSFETDNISSEMIDYKKLCKQLLKENELLRKRIKDLEEAEKKREQEFGREKRSLQRTISEQEEELKQQNEIKADNLKLKDENAALIRVISKLSK